MFGYSFQITEGQDIPKRIFSKWDGTNFVRKNGAPKAFSVWKKFRISFIDFTTKQSGARRRWRSLSWIEKKLLPNGNDSCFQSTAHDFLCAFFTTFFDVFAVIMWAQCVLFNHDWNIKINDVINHENVLRPSKHARTLLEIVKINFF